MKKSKILSILLAVIVTLSSFSCLSVVSFAAVIDSDGPRDELGALIGTDWEFDDSGVLTIYEDIEDPTWTKYIGSIKEVVFLNPVKMVKDYLFSGYPKLEKITFNSELSDIGKCAFQDCDALKTVTLSGIGSVGEYAFYDCDSLEKVIIKGNTGFAGKNIFKSCDGLKTVEIENGITRITEGMFEDCVALESINLPDSIEAISRLAFENCASLKEIIIPDSTMSVGEYAFYDCKAAKSAYIGHNVQSIGEYAFGKCTALENVEIKCAMPIISEGMFYGCSSLKGLANLPEGIKEIGKNAFKDCSSFAEIAIPSSVTVIGDSAFDGTAIISIDIPAGVEVIGSGAFSNCSKLTAINVAAKNRFYASKDGILYNSNFTDLISCPAAKTGEVSVKDGTSKIREDAFIGCSAIETVAIPDSVEEIATNAFNGCSDTLKIKANCDSYAASYAAYHAIDTEITHSNLTSWIVTIEPDCDDTGVKERQCTACGNVKETGVVDALGHSYEGVVTKEASCDEDGVMTYTCTRTDCDDTYTDVIPATGHSYDDGVVTIEATCEAEGVKTFTCENGCGSTYTEAIPAIGHDYDDGVVTLAPTCDVEGEKTFTCKNGCGTTYTEPVPALTHNYIATVLRAGTCIAKGATEYRCENCGDTYTEKEYGEHQLYSSPVRIEPTCDKEGKEGQMCALCKEFVGEVTILPAVSHTESKWIVGDKATCTSAGSKYKECTDCGIVLATEEIAALGHSEGDWIIDKAATANAAGKKHKECTECGETLETAAISQLKCSRPEVEKVSNISKGVKIDWSAVSGADYYRVYRKTKNGEWKYLDSTKKTSFTDDTAKSGTKYYYSVRAINEAGISARSNSLSRYYLEDPTLKSATSTKKGVSLKWSKVAGAEGYIVYRKTGTGSYERIKLENGVSNTSYTDKSAKKGTKYTYKVKAFYSKTSSDYSRTRVVTDKY